MTLSSNQKISITIGLSVAFLVGGYFLYDKFLSPKSRASLNFKNLQENINMKPDSSNIVIAPFKSEGKTYYSQFYSNNRVIIFGADKKILNKGTYFDGGKTIVLDNGKQSSDEIVWTNLLNLVK